MLHGRFCDRCGSALTGGFTPASWGDLFVHWGWSPKCQSTELWWREETEAAGPLVVVDGVEWVWADREWVAA